MDKLKKLAERLGYNAVIEGDYVFLDGEWEPTGARVVFNPLTNNDQFVEVLEKRKIFVSYDYDLEAWEASACPHEGDSIFVHEALRHAVLNAALEIGDE